MNYSTPSSIKSWAEEDRPREKLILKGKASLSNAELIAILIGSGSQKETAVELSKKILSHYDNNLQELSKASVQALCEFSGIGEAKAISIISAMELGRRYRSTEAKIRKKISSSRDAYDAIYSYLADCDYEEFYVILLNRANDIISIQKISEGGTSGTVVDPKKVFKLAINYQASGMILCHNHPSGNMKASQQDKIITKRLKDSGDLIEISILDHIIVGNGNYFSFSDEGLI
ncbi:DNA repair protein RadC [Lentimicrobium sp. S6]|uniref:RadC family protein n=1 Tax=Lentimicrobium sp. S6 TaxID=2735872 RepID=UPI001555C982|nr:DNA repair protein RadC [Lentimicrobium sp. S6]NPD46235.1 DNA repair protein RadC [Lentimicrobium sp. S6]